jgi:hypothetical protein
LLCSAHVLYLSLVIDFFFISDMLSINIHVRRVPATTAWRVLSLRMEKRPPAI